MSSAISRAVMANSMVRLSPRSITPLQARIGVLAYVSPGPGERTSSEPKYVRWRGGHFCGEIFTSAAKSSCAFTFHLVLIQVRCDRPAQRRDTSCPARADLVPMELITGMIQLLLHFELHDGVGVGGSRGAACRGGLHGERQHGARGVIFRDGAGVVGRGGNGHILSGRAIRQPHDGVRRAARWRGLGLDLNPRYGDRLVERPGLACPG